MAKSDLILDREVISTIEDVKAKLEKKKSDLTDWETKLKRKEIELNKREQDIEKQMANFNNELNQIIKNAKAV